MKYQKPDILEDSLRSLAGHVYLVTGANTGIGKEITTHLAKKGATVYMVCRNFEKAQKARDEIVQISKSPSVHVLQCDCSLESDVRKLWKDFESSQSKGENEIQSKNASKKIRLDGIVCNAGALLNEKTLTTEGVEVSLCCRIIFEAFRDKAVNVSNQLRKKGDFRCTLAVWNIPSWLPRYGNIGSNRKFEIDCCV